jgi:hypothetical protein
MNQILFPSFIKPWEDRGHSFVGNIEECDVVLFDLHARIADYKQENIQWVINNNPKLVSFDEWDRGGMSTEQWPEPLTQQQHYALLYSNRVCHFCRLLDKTRKYEHNLYPYEKPILYEEPMLTADELFNREYDIVFIANSAPQREYIKTVLEGTGLKCNIILGAQKIPFNDWVNEHKKGKLFMTWSAGGFTDERAQALFSVAAMIKEDNDQLLLHPFTNSVNCVSLSSNPTKQELDYLRLVCGNKDELYKIYKGCYEYMVAFYNSVYIANNILDLIEQHL